MAWTIYFGLRFSVQYFEIQYFLGFSKKMDIFGGMNKIVDIFFFFFFGGGGHYIIGLIGGVILYILGFFFLGAWYFIG